MHATVPVPAGCNVARLAPTRFLSVSEAKIGHMVDMSSPMPSTPADRIAECFNEYFEHWKGVRIVPEDVVIGARSSVADQASGWYVTYRVDADHDGLPTLEFYAINRFTNDRWGVIGADGRGQEKQAISDFASSASDYKRNDAIAKELRDRGLR